MPWVLGVEFDNNFTERKYNFKKLFIVITSKVTTFYINTVSLNKYANYTFSCPSSLPILLWRCNPWPFARSQNRPLALLRTMMMGPQCIPFAPLFLGLLERISFIPRHSVCLQPPLCKDRITALLKGISRPLNRTALSPSKWEQLLNHFKLVLCILAIIQHPGISNIAERRVLGISWRRKKS